VRRDKLLFVSRAAREFGGVVLFRMGPKRRLYLLSHPLAVRRVLQENPRNYVKGIGLEQARPALGEGILTSEGDLWAGQRENLNKAFQHDKLAEYADAMAAAVDAMLGRWRAAARGGAPVDVAAEAVAMTLDVLGRSLFGVDLNGIGPRLTDALDEVVHWSIRRMTALAPLPLGVPTPGNLRCRRALRELDGLVDEVVRRRREAPASGGALLSSLLGMRDEAGDPAARRLLRSEIVTLLLAGHETTATTLAWASHLLAADPATQQRLRAEASAVLGERLPTLPDLQRLPFTRMVVEETLRLYPPVWMITRRAIADDLIGGYAVPAGSDILISVHTLHRHPDFWDAPEEFRPERFAAERSRARPSHSYLPFSTGPRSCVGSGFAMLEATLALAMIVRAFRLSAAPGPPVEPEPLLTLRPRNGLRLILEPAG